MLTLTSKTRGRFCIVAPHTHITPVHLIAACLAVLVTFGTLHLLALSQGDTRFSRAIITLGF